MVSYDLKVPSSPAVHRRSSLYVKSHEGQPGSLFSSITEPSIVQRNSNDVMQEHQSLEEVRDTQEMLSIRHRGHSIGAVASVPGASKKAKLRALGLVFDSNASEQ